MPGLAVRPDNTLTLGEVRQHVRAAIGVWDATKRFQCPVCEKTPSKQSRTEFIKHILTHMADEYREFLPFKCPANGCLYTANKCSGITAHYESIHPELPATANIPPVDWSFYEDGADVRPYEPTDGDPTSEDLLRLLDEAIDLGDTQSYRRAFNGRIEYWFFNELQRAVLKRLKELVTIADETTLRGIFYTANGEALLGVNTTAAAAARALQSVCKKIGIMRHQMPVSSSPNGYVCGNIQLRNASTGSVTVLNRSPVQIKEDLAVEADVAIELVHAADIDSADRPFILWVEHHVAFEKLRHSFCDLYPRGILLTGCGNPSFATRRFCKRLAERFSLQVLLMFDCDPYGLRMALTIKYGSDRPATNAASGDITVPHATWIGLRSADVCKARVYMLLTAAGERRLTGVRRVAVSERQDQFVSEADLMQQTRHTYHMQHLSANEILQVLRKHLPWSNSSRAAVTANACSSSHSLAAATSADAPTSTSKIHGRVEKVSQDVGLDVELDRLMMKYGASPGDLFNLLRLRAKSTREEVLPDAVNEHFMDPDSTGSTSTILLPDDTVPKETFQALRDSRQCASFKPLFRQTSLPQYPRSPWGPYLPPSFATSVRPPSRVHPLAAIVNDTDEEADVPVPPKSAPRPKRKSAEAATRALQAKKQRSASDSDDDASADDSPSDKPWHFFSDHESEEGF